MALVVAGAAAIASLAWSAPALAGPFTFLDKWGAIGVGNGEFKQPADVAIDSVGNIYVADQKNNRIQKFTEGGRFRAKWGQLDGKGTAGEEPGAFNNPFGVATDGVGNVYVADTFNHRMQKFNSIGTLITLWGKDGTGGGGLGIGSGKGNGEFTFPESPALDVAGNVYVADTANHRIQKFTSSGSFITKWGRNGGDGTPGTAEGEFEDPASVALDGAGNVYVADRDNHRIQKFDSSGDFIRMWGWGVQSGAASPQTCTAGCQAGLAGAGNGQFSDPRGVAPDPSGNVYVSDTVNNRIQKFNSTGAFLTKFGSGGTGDGQFDRPGQITTDCRGSVYVADTFNHRIQKLGDPAAAPCSSGPPALTVKAKAKQAARRLTITAKCGGQDCTLKVGGTAKVPRRELTGLRLTASAKAKRFTVKKKSVELLPGDSEKIRLKLKQHGKSVKQIRKLQKKSGAARKRAKLKLTVTAIGAGGSKKTKKTIKHKP